MQAVAALGRAAEGALADLDDVAAVLRGHDGTRAVLQHQRRVVGRGEDEPVGVHNGHVGIEERLAQPQPFDLDRNPLPFLGIHGEIIDVLVLDHAVDGRVEVDLLRLVEIVVRLDLVDLGQGPHAEGVKVADAAGGLQTQATGPQPAAGRDGQPGLHRFVGEHGQTFYLNARVVEQDAAGIGQSRPAEHHVHFGAALCACRRDAVDLRRSGVGGHRQSESQQGNKDPQSTREKTGHVLRPPPVVVPLSGTGAGIRRPCHALTPLSRKH